VGSFKDYRNAQQLQQKLAGQGYGAEVLSGENSFYRVSANNYQQKSAAVAALSGIRSLETFSSAWILSQ
jgi:cell division protein FtsN